ncbi:MAG: LysM peptidoglycan-binding domain-containing protein [Candidatus Binatia bacterium]
MKKVNLLISICLVLVATVASCRLARPTPDPAEIERLVAEAVQATIEAMPTATPYPTYTPVPSASTYTPSASVYTPRPTHTGTVVPITPGSQPGSTFRTYIVVAGDTLSGIAREYGTTVEAIMGANELSDPGLIIVGQVLSIPIEAAGPASTTATPTPLTPTATLTPTTPTSLTPTATPTSPTTTPTETPAS